MRRRKHIEGPLPNKLPWLLHTTLVMSCYDGPLKIINNINLGVSNATEARLPPVHLLLVQLLLSALQSDLRYW